MAARYRAFVGSRRKADDFKRELAAEGVPAEALAAIKAPAGLDIAAISSDEIALSILAEMIAARRKPERPPADNRATEAASGAASRGGGEERGAAVVSLISAPIYAIASCCLFARRGPPNATRRHVLSIDCAGRRVVIYCDWRNEL